MIQPYERTRKMADLLDGDMVFARDLEYRREHKRRVGQVLSEEAVGDNGGVARRAETSRLQQRIQGWLGEHESLDSLAVIPEPAQRESGDRKASPVTGFTDKPLSPPRAYHSRRRHADTDEFPARSRSRVTHTGPSWYQVRMRMLVDAAKTQAARCCDPPAVVHRAACCRHADEPKKQAARGVEAVGALSVVIWAMSFAAALYAI